LGNVYHAFCKPYKCRDGACGAYGACGACDAYDAYDKWACAALPSLALDEQP
jgi:hypothetical protein